MINTLKTGIIWEPKYDPWYIWVTSPDHNYLLYDGNRALIPRSVEQGKYFVATNTYDGAIDTNLTYKVIVDYFIQTRPGYRKIRIQKHISRYSREYIDDYVEDTRREQVDKINFMSNIIVNKIDVPVNDDLAVLRLLKQIFVDKRLEKI